MPKLLKCVLIISCFALILLIGLAANAQLGASAYPTYSGKGPKVTPAEIQQAGFTNVKNDATIESRINTGNYYPVYYFRVNETLSGEQGLSWGDSANLVEVFVREMPIGYVFNGGQMQVSDLAGKTKATSSIANYYFEVIGPVHDNVVNLLGILTNSI